MPKFADERQVYHSASDMFELVADVESYPRFVPLCERLVVRGRSRCEEGDVLVADMTIAYKLVRETFTSRVTLDRSDRKITVSYIDGPFRHLNNVWTFEEVSKQESIVRFSIDYEFKSSMLGALMGTVFDRAFRKFSAAFEARADEIYGTPKNIAAATR